MSKMGETVYEAVLTRGDVSPKKMEHMVNVLLLGKSEEQSSLSDENNNPQVFESRQLKGDPFQALASGEYIEPRYNPDVWAAAMESNTRLGRAIRTYARNTVGLGWYIEPVQKIGPETPEEFKKKVIEQTTKLLALFNKPNSKVPLNQIFFYVKIDEEAIGNGYIEVVRDLSGKIIQLYHAPGVTMRVRIRKSETDPTNVEIGGFVQVRGNEKRYFKEFGDKRIMDAFTGKYAEENEFIPLHRRATEILHFKLYSPTNTWYGAPRYVSAAPAITGNRLAALRNVNFFENDAVPRMAITVSGGRLTPESVQAVEDFFKSKVGGVNKSHSCIVLQTEAQRVGFQQSAEHVTIGIQPLTVGVTEDASFETYRKSNDEEVREAFGIAQAFFATDNVNKASAQVSREITNEQEFEPDRLEKEYLINQTIVRDVLDLPENEEPEVRFRFERMKLTDPLDTARMDQTYAGLGALTPNELRASIGKPPYPPEYKFADKPLQVAMTELNLQVAEAIVGEFKTKLKFMEEQGKIHAAQQQSAMGMFGGAGGGEALEEGVSEEVPWDSSYWEELGGEGEASGAGAVGETSAEGAKGGAPGNEALVEGVETKSGDNKKLEGNKKGIEIAPLNNISLEKSKDGNKSVVYPAESLGIIRDLLSDIRKMNCSQVLSLRDKD